MEDDNGRRTAPHRTAVWAVGHLENGRGARCMPVRVRDREPSSGLGVCMALARSRASPPLRHAWNAALCVTNTAPDQVDGPIVTAAILEAAWSH